MITEEKAKAYDEAIEQLRTMFPNWENLSYNGKTFLQDIVSIFPELKWNEYESTRKRIIALVNAHGQGRFKENMLAWIEKLKVFAEHGDGLYYFANSEFTYVGNPTWDNVSFLEKQGQKKCVDDLTQQEAMDAAVAKCFEQGEQKPTWSEEDDDYFNDVIAFLEDARDCRQNALDCIDWMWTLKQRIGG